MAEPVDRRRFLAASTAAMAGTLLGSSKVQAAPAEGPRLPTAFSVEESESALLLRSGSESVRITFCAPDVAHVVASGKGLPDGASPAAPWILTPYRPLKPEVTRSDNRVVARTAKMSVEIDLKDGLLRFLDPSDRPLLKESPRVPRRYLPRRSNDEMLFRVEQR
ncbi:MAG TPA: hypothetical protein VI653_20625, partial [Steroidobacteraceae bacterium]